MSIELIDSELQVMHKICQKVDPTGLIGEVISIREKIEKHFEERRAEAIMEDNAKMTDSDRAAMEALDGDTNAGNPQ